MKGLQQSSSIQIRFDKHLIKGHPNQPACWTCWLRLSIHSYHVVMRIGKFDNIISPVTPDALSVSSICLNIDQRWLKHFGWYKLSLFVRHIVLDSNVCLVTAQLRTTLTAELVHIYSFQVRHFPQFDHTLTMQTLTDHLSSVVREHIYWQFVIFRMVSNARIFVSELQTSLYVLCLFNLLMCIVHMHAIFCFASSISWFSFVYAYFSIVSMTRMWY